MAVNTLVNIIKHITEIIKHHVYVCYYTKHNNNIVLNTI